MSSLTHFHPFFRTPLTDLGAYMITHQSAGKCNDFEMRAVECVEAYGTSRGETVCKDYLEDLRECMVGEKALKRHEAMRMERERQVAAGERSKENMYPVKAKIDGY